VYNKVQLYCLYTTGL